MLATLAAALFTLSARAPSRAMMSGAGNRAALEALTVKALKAQLRERDLPVSGRKAVLVDRLLDGGAASAAAPATARAAARAAPSGRTSTDSVPMDPTPRAASPTVPLVLASWNVAGLRGLLKKDEARASLASLVVDERADVIMLQETKLQEQHVADAQAALLTLLADAAPGSRWRAAWDCSSERKGYAGVATFWRESCLGGAGARGECIPLSVDDGHEAGREGRTLVLALPLDDGAEVRLAHVYTPNSGAALARLGYRTGAAGWDARFFGALASRGVHVAGGDYNVAVEDADFYNPEAKHMATQAGTTPEERASMRARLANSGYVDAFRARHPAASGQYTYWSQRARNRPRNRGLRLDYWLVAEAVAGGGGALADAQHLQRLGGSDHCPILLTLDAEALARAAQGE